MFNKKLTNFQVSTQGFYWELVVTATLGKVAITSRNIDVLGKLLSRVKFITFWSVPPAGSASCIISLCKYLQCFESACNQVQLSGETLGSISHTFFTMWQLNLENCSYAKKID